MKDRQGVIRGKCAAPGCECSEYMTSQGSGSPRCEYCDHVPVKHVKMIKLGACMKCKECAQYETEEPGSYSNCGYCDCPAQHHQGAEKCMFTPRPVPTQTSLGTSTLPAGPPITAISAVSTAPGQCKIPGCTKPCFVEKGGRIHEFCGKTHADQYKKIQQAPKTTTDMMFQTSAATAATTSQQFSVMPGLGLMQMSSAKEMSRICEQCRVHPANKGYKICQRCYLSSKT